MYILAFGGELEDFCGSQGFAPYMFPMLFPILFSRCSLILSHTSWDACSFRKCCKFGHKFYWHGDISSLKMKQVKKFTLHSILADWIKKCCLEIVSWVALKNSYHVFICSICVFGGKLEDFCGSQNLFSMCSQWSSQFVLYVFINLVWY